MPSFQWPVAIPLRPTCTKLRMCLSGTASFVEQIRSSYYSYLSANVEATACAEQSTRQNMGRLVGSYNYMTHHPLAAKHNAYPPPNTQRSPPQQLRKS